MRPGIERIANKIGHRVDKLPIFLVIVVGTGDGVLLVSPCAESAPLIMVAIPVAGAQPRLGEVAELLVLVYFLRGEMTVIVDYGHILGVFVIQFSRRLCLQQKIFIHKIFHIITLLLF